MYISSFYVIFIDTYKDERDEFCLTNKYQASKEKRPKNKEGSVGRDRNEVDERVTEIISGRHREGRVEGRGQEAAWGVL